MANRLWTLSPAITAPLQCFAGFTNPAFPLISEDLLVANNAIYGGVMHDSLAGEVELVKFIGLCLIEAHMWRSDLLTTSRIVGYLVPGSHPSDGSAG